MKAHSSNRQIHTGRTRFFFYHPSSISCSSAKADEMSSLLIFSNFPYLNLSEKNILTFPGAENFHWRGNFKETAAGVKHSSWILSVVLFNICSHVVFPLKIPVTLHTAYLGIVDDYHFEFTQIHWISFRVIAMFSDSRTTDTAGSVTAIPLFRLSNSFHYKRLLWSLFLSCNTPNVCSRCFKFIRKKSLCTRKVVFLVS